MRSAPLALLALLLAAFAPSAGAQEAPPEPEPFPVLDNESAFPPPEEVRDPGWPLSWWEPLIALLFLSAAAGVLLYIWRASRSDRRGVRQVRRRR